MIDPGRLLVPFSGRRKHSTAAPASTAPTRFFGENTGGLDSRSTGVNEQARLPICRMVFAVLGIFLAAHASSQDGMPKPVDRSTIPAVLPFQAERAGQFPTGWDAASPETIFADNAVVYHSSWSARIERTQTGSSAFSAIEKTILGQFEGKTIELRGFLRNEDLKGSANLYIRQNGTERMLAFDKSKSPTEGSHDWAEYSVSVPLNEDARQISFGVAFDGRGKVWVGELRVVVDGKPVAEAPGRKAEASSGVRLNSLSQFQLTNLSKFGKIWGFLKYHHPIVTAGKLDWDKECLKLLPEVLAAQDQTQGNAVLFQWISGLGKAEPCTKCARLDESDIQLRPEIAWIRDKVSLGSDLSESLQRIYENRSAKTQFYVSMVPSVGNPSFDHERDYERIAFPDSGYQILAVYRFWNIIQYWAPYRDLVKENWEQALPRFLSRVALAPNADAYKLEMMAMIAEVRDTHANLWSSIDLRPPAGACELPVTIRFLDNDAIVADSRAKNAEVVSHLQAGDLLEAIDGSPVSSLISQWERYYAASNETTVRRDIARVMTKGSCGVSHLKIKRGNQSVGIEETRHPASQLKAAETTHDLPGDAFRLLTKDVGYLKLSAVKLEDLKGYFEAAKGTKGLIIDLRSYPSAFVVFAIGNHLVEKQTAFARFTAGDLSNPGAFHWTEPISLKPEAPHYSGEVAILVDEVSQSQAEYTAMAFRAAPRALVIGSTTAGADGNVSAISLPGGLRTMISGIGVFYPNKQPTQQVGIIPDVVVRRTIAGIREGRDEVFEEALRLIDGRIGAR